MTEAPYSLRGVLLRRLWLPLLVLLLASAVGSFVLARHYAEQVYDRWLLDSAMSLAQLTEVRGDAVHMEISPAVSRMFTWDTVDRIYGEVTRADGTRLYGAAVLPGGTALQAEGADDSPARTYYDAVIDGQEVRVVQVAMTPPGAAAPILIRVAETRTKRLRLEHRLLLASIPLQGTILLLAAWLAWSGTGAAARHTNGAARRLASAPLDALAPLDPREAAPRELWPAVDAFNQLVHRLSAMQDAQQRFISNAAHQLRTPLAGLQIELESALREQDRAAQRDALAGLLRGLTRLRHLTHQLLILSRSEDSAGAMLAMRPVDLAVLARDELERMMDRAVVAGVDLGYEGPDAGVMVRGEPQLLRETISNLVDNALRYGALEGVITVSVETARGETRLSVNDDGPGIDPLLRSHVTERFWRGDASGDGCGLGLAIVAEIAERHRATLSIGRSALGGAQVTLAFPSRLG
ncbi:histidine kinase [Stenotrophomonas maltophilia]|uniref:histidine kinase n=1 Tax=Stenotrophomonas maltophilia TaxID=40324 RepID=A0A246HJ06_STEMA|nr:sensor histidine kinase [Stenotrophomonas maltophilia]OWQ50530.1 histidine kinase [Stenotrophomonas maltophilia]